MDVQYLDSEKAKTMIAELSEKMDGHLIEGRTYHSDITKNVHGSSGGTIYFYEDGMLHNYANYGKYAKEEFEEHIEKIENSDFSSLITFFPVHSKIKFTLKKGEPINAMQFTVFMLLEYIKDTIKNDNWGTDGTLIKLESLIHFRQEADELGMFVDSTLHFTNSIKSVDFIMESDAVKSIYYLLGEKLKRLYFIYQDGTITAQSYPAFEEYGLKLLTIDHIELEPAYKKRKAAFDNGKKIRHDFYNAIGKLDERVIFLRVGGFRDNSWPENSTSHNSCKMRVIYSEESTILITDGLSDVYMKARQDENVEYNGIGAEFYMEFHATIPYEVIHKHFAVALVNSVSQIAIGHTDFKKFIQNHGQTSIEFNEENVNLWVNRENSANHDFSSFLTTKFKKKNNFGVLLGLESKIVPQKIQLNLEEVLLISIKPIDKKWITKTKLASNKSEVVKESAEKIIKEFKENGEWNLVPLTYQKQYIQGEPNSSGVVLTPIFPF
jgi:hypothetical protein